MKLPTRKATVGFDEDQLAEALGHYTEAAAAADRTRARDLETRVDIIIDGEKYCGVIDVLVCGRYTEPITVVLDIKFKAQKDERWFVVLNRSKNADTWHPKHEILIGELDLELYVGSWVEH
jgi:hypothetical protein